MFGAKVIDPGYKAVTVCCATLNAVHALDLMIRSLRKHHQASLYDLWVYDNGSTDGAKELGRGAADRFFDGPAESHGVALDKMCREVATPFTLVVDSDVEFLEPVMAAMMAEISPHDFKPAAFCVSPPDRYGQGSSEFMGVKTYGQPRIDPCCALFWTGELQLLLQHTSFAFYVSPHQGKHYDTGSALYHTAAAVHATMKTPDWLWERIHHWGTMSWALGAPAGSEERRLAEERYEAIRERLEGVTR